MKLRGLLKSLKHFSNLSNVALDFLQAFAFGLFVFACNVKSQNGSRDKAQHFKIHNTSFKGVVGWLGRTTNPIELFISEKELRNRPKFSTIAGLSQGSEDIYFLIMLECENV